MIHVKTIIREVEGRKFFVKELLLDGQHPLVIMQKDLETPSTIFNEKLINLFEIGKINYTTSRPYSFCQKPYIDNASLTFDKIENEENCFFISTTAIQEVDYEKEKLAVRVLDGGDNFKDDFLILNWR